MEFQHPEFLYYMLPPLFILFGLLLTQKEAQATFFSQEVMDRLRVSSNRLTLKSRNALFMLIGVLMIIALASPVIPEGKVEVKAKSADIMLALDISDSMLAQDLYPNRLKLSKQKALELLKLAPNERIGVIAFAKNSYLVSPLSFDHDAVGFLLRQLSTDSITEKGTDFLSMLEVVDKSIKNESKKYLLILSDGGDKEDFSAEIAYAKEKNITIFVLGVATKKGAPIKLEEGGFIKHNGEIIVSKLNSNISTLATKTGGVFIQSIHSVDDVKAMLREIESHSEQKELKSQEIERFVPLFYFPLGLALLLLLIATSSMSKREKVSLPSAFLLFALFVTTPDVKAGLLDFMELEKAKKAYEDKDYETSSKLYSDYAKSSQKKQSYYNAANALYKVGKYKEARELYEQAQFSEPLQRADNFANLGNAYAKEPNKENLEKAIGAYESALKLKEDKDTRENLEAVKKALENMNNQENQQQQNQDKNEDNKEKNQDQSQKQQNNNQENKENSQENQKQNENSQEQKNNKNQKEQESQNKQNAQDKKQEQKESENEKKEQEHKEKNEQDAAKELKEEKPQEKGHSMNSSQKPQEMSDKEEKKWLQMLNKDPSTYLYRLNENRNDRQENTNEKPW
ncbi:MAG: VWA domain-containing protein [Campylobacterales bacterium]|nr:VWA domain-containing protein [Campylobacterales bacterium]